MSAPHEPNFYEVLGVPQDATPEQIKDAHRRAMRIYHPDVHTGNQADAVRMAVLLNEAQAVLMNPISRERYDATLRGDATPSAAAEQQETSFEDAWGEDAEWEEVLDDEVLDDDPMPASPPSPSSPPPGSSPPTSMGWFDEASALKDAPVRVVTSWVGLRVPLLVAAGAVLVAVVVSLFAPSTGIAYPSIVASLVWAGAGFVLGAVVTTFLTKDTSKLQPVRHPLFVVVLLPVTAALVAMLLLGFNTVSANVVNAAGAFAIGFVVTHALYAHRALEDVVAAASLRKNTTFGRLPGRVSPDLLDRNIHALYVIPSVRVMRNSLDRGLFSHAIVNGTRVAFVRAVVGPRGVYRWSGPSLLCQPQGRAELLYPVEVLRGPYREFMQTVRGALPKGTTVEEWVFVYTEDGGQLVSRHEPSARMPRVTAPDVGMEQIGRFLLEGSGDELVVDQATFVAASRSLLLG